MYRNTRFGDLMKALPREVFKTLVNRHQADKYTKGFGSWDHLLAMIFGQLCGCRSLRELEAGFNNQSVHHYHLGTRELKRSTLSDANIKRDSGLFESVCHHLLAQLHGKGKGELQDLLYLIDSTPIPLKGLGYDAWTKENRTDRTQGLKLHMMWSADTEAPVYTRTTAPNVNDVEAGREMPLEQGATYVFDKGYCDYNWDIAIITGGIASARPVRTLSPV